MDVVFVLFVLSISVFVGIGGTAFWIWMLVDAAKHEPIEGNDRLIWILVIALTHLVGAGIYFFARRPERDRLIRQAERDALPVSE
ncbi:MAG: PLDc N-terminal domain-containing protein [Gemmatimonadetes bacterium]|nr:PLDc N-terminal domain-containing protein [Gemmatimonadota bacterium]